MADDAVFRISGLRKSFGPIEVLKGVDLSLHAGKVTVLMGANGAGKSTLVRIVCGVYRSGGGEMRLDGAPFEPATSAGAIRAGVVTVHQNINDGIVPDLDVATNLTLDHLAGGGSPVFFNPGRVRRQARAVAERMELEIDLDTEVADLSLADRQMVAIARAMAQHPKVLILDEPTSSLSSAEANRLFALIDRLRERGVAILYISHRMSDIRRLADRIITLRDGVATGTFETQPLDYEGAVVAMLGRQIVAAHVEVQSGEEEVFRAEGLSVETGAQPFNLALRDGEIVVVTGLVGVGKSALAETLFGVRAPVSGHMQLGGKPYAPKTAQQAINGGVFLIAKDRGVNGIVHDFNILQNITLPFLKRFSAVSVLSGQRETRAARDQIEALDIVCRNEKDPMGTLSGGNQQKVVVARWLSQTSRLLVLDEPFQGVDIAARRDIADKLRDTAKGRATLVLLTELDEVFEVADRIIVMSEHTLVGEHVNRDVNVERLLAEITGQRAAEDATVAA